MQAQPGNYPSRSFQPINSIADHSLATRSQKYGKIKTRDKALFEGGGGSGSASNGVSKATPAKKSKSKSTTPAAKRKSGYSAKDMGKGYGPNPLDGLDMEREEDEDQRGRWEGVGRGVLAANWIWLFFHERACVLLRLRELAWVR